MAGGKKKYYNFFIKRLNSAWDFENLREINDQAKNSDSEYLRGYLDHTHWLNNIVLPDIKNGSRIAFGAYKMPSLQSKIPYEPEGAEWQLLGSVIIKKEISGDVHIKNLLTNSAAINAAFSVSKPTAREIKRNIQEKLIERVENFCAYRKLQRLETEVPANEYELINLFLRKAYKVINTRKFRYRKDDHYYAFSKELLSIVGNDPFDFFSIGKNILQLFYPIKIIPEDQQVIPHGHIREGALFEVMLNPLAINKQSKKKHGENGVLEEKLKLQAECIFDISDETYNNDYVEKVRKFLPNSQLKILITNNEEVNLNTPELKNIKVLQWRLLEQELGLKNHLLSSFFKLKDIGGYFLAMEDRYIERIISKCHTGIKFHIFNGQGSYLNYDSGADAIVFFYSAGLNDHKNEGIWGYGKLKDLPLGKKIEMYDANDDFNFFSREEYDMYANFIEPDDLVVLMSIYDIKILQPAMKINTGFFSARFQEYIKEREDSEWYQAHWFDSYLDKDSVKILKDKVDSHLQRFQSETGKMNNTIAPGPGISKLLFISAIPKDNFDIRDFGWKECFESAKNRYKDLNVILLERANLTLLLRECTCYPDVIHFHGHGAEDGIYLLDPDTQDGKKISNEILLHWLLMKYSQVKLLVFTSCYSNKQAEVLSEHFPYILGLNGEAEQTTGDRLFKYFYESISGESRSLEEILAITCHEFQDNRRYLGDHIVLWRHGVKINYKELMKKT